MARYSSGKKAFLIDERSGFKIRYKDARTEWTGVKVHKSDYDSKHPQLEPQKYLKKTRGGVLRNPRPDNDNKNQTTTYRAGPLFKGFAGKMGTFIGEVRLDVGEDSPGFGATVSQGTPAYTASTLPSGIAGTSGLGSITAISQTNPSGQQGTSAQGTGLTFNLTENAVGITGTTGIGSLIFSATENAVGIQGTSAQGSVIPQTIAVIDGSALQMTAGRGTITVQQPGWGNNPYGLGTWNA
tara:strand:+ start:43 stop:762 length:720 start_codon:yes stop_codon:yes gene_type:complete